MLLIKTNLAVNHLDIGKGVFMKRILFTLALFFCLTTTAFATELLMFSMKSCGYCRSFLKEVAQEYNSNPEHARLLPLRIISMDRPQAPKWFDDAYNRQSIDGIQGTPTFIVWDGEERARLIGYNGKERFYDDISRFINSNRSQLEARVGQNKIPFEPDTEMTPKYALQESMGESPDRTNQSEGSHSQSVPQQQHPTVPFMAPNFGAKEKSKPAPLEKLPNGVFNSRDIMDHIYDTETEAQVAANWLGCMGTHTHIMKGKKIWMPCKME